LGLSYLALLFCIFLTFDSYSAHVLNRDSIQAATDTLASLTNLAEARPPQFDDATALRAWTQWAASSGAWVTVIAESGEVLADSGRGPEATNGRGTRPEIEQAFSSGEGESVRHSATMGVDFVYRAVRYQPQFGSPVVIRMGLPLAEIDSSVAELRGKLFGASLLILAIAATISLASFRMFTARVERLKRFSRRLADGDFRPLPAERPRDELSELADALNEMAASMDRTIRSLSGERNRSSAILRSMVEGVAVVDAEERIVFSNRAFSEILNLDAAAIEGRPVIEVVRNSGLLGLIRRALNGEEGLQTDIAMGFVQPRTFSITATPVQALESGVPGGSFIVPAVPEKPSGAVVVLHDVTELRRLERVRQDFVANVSHEFKTPLTAIQGFAETLLAGAMEDSHSNRRFMEIIRDHAIRLARLTNDLLKLARIEAGKLEVEFFPVQLMEVIERAMETTLLKASRKQIALEVDIPPGLPMVRGDASLLRDVLQNLIDNAIQYTSEGGRIHVSASAGTREVVACVADTGIGIPLVDQERIFERFYRVDAARSREAGGTGLGLSIAKHIVEAHGGRLWVESEVGRGSKFFFSVPLAT
jgi:two-component system, OmpR family, phosphate regulon sensor histidine kinase PhoR